MRNPIVPLVIIAIIIIGAAITSLQQHSVVGNAASTGSNEAATPAPVEPTTVSQAAEPHSEALPAPTPNEAPTAEPTATRQPIPPQLQAKINYIEQGAADLRGLQPLDDVPETFLTRAQFREQYVKEMKQTVSLDDVRLYLQQLWMLRLVDDPSIDFYELSADLGSDGILGYYDPVSKQLYVITDQLNLDAEAQVTLAHEFVHSLQDEHYKLKKIWPVGVEDQDRVMAIKSLVEGDATLSGYGWAANYMSGKDFRSLFEQKTLSKDVQVRTPPYLGISTIYPYSAGPEFVIKLMQVGGFSTVNLALQDPPRSTEQIMHPEKFLQVPIDQPKAVALPDLSGPLGKGWELKETNTLGEFDLNMMLKENGASDPNRGADGWGGGKFSVYKLEQEILVYSSVVWDTENDAKEFEGALGETFVKMPLDGPFRTDKGRYFTMSREGKKVTFIASTNRPALERVVAAK